jgi:CubicO group peptidase (beta-lactamase class C family)
MMALVIPASTFTPDGPWVSLRREYYFDFPGHGGLIVSSQAYAIFLQAVLRQDPLLLNSGSWREFFKPQARSGDTCYALGWMVLEDHGRVYYQHTGGALGRLACITVYPDQNLASVYLSNLLDSSSVAAVHQPVLDRLFLDNRK